MGPGVGEIDGDSDGEPVGVDVGSEVVGEKVGDVVGSEVVGAAVGDSVGSDVVGDSVGDGVGSLVGGVVGDGVGIGEGSEVAGDRDGGNVGTGVGGAGVGASVAHSAGARQSPNAQVTGQLEVTKATTAASLLPRVAIESTKRRAVGVLSPPCSHKDASVLQVIWMVAFLNRRCSTRRCTRQSM